MFNLLAFFEAITTSGEINAVTGTNEYVQNNRHVLRENGNLIAAYASGATATRARILAPSLRIVAPPQIRPLNVALLPAADPNMADYRREPVRLMAREEISIEIFNTGPENTYGLLWVAELGHRFSLPAGQPYVIRATGATTAVASAWTNVPLTYDEQLPAGEYEIVGMEVIGTTCVAARLIFPGQNLYRPGVLGQATAGGRGYASANAGLGLGFIDGGFGTFGRFVTTALPSVEVMCNAADTAQTVFFKCIKVA